MTAEERTKLKGRPVLLYDGYCGLCNGIVRFCAKRDPAQEMRFVPLQSEVGRELLARYGETPESLESVAVFLRAMTEEERFFHHSDAVARALGQLRTPWNWVGRWIGWIPRFLREPGYAFVGRVRYAVFGRYAACPLPSPEMRARFVGAMDPGCLKG